MLVQFKGGGATGRLTHTIQVLAVQFGDYGDYGVAYRQIGKLLEDLLRHTRIGS